MRRGLVVYADATGARLQTSGTSDVAILREYFRGRPVRRGASSRFRRRIRR